MTKPTCLAAVLASVFSLALTVPADAQNEGFVFEGSECDELVALLAVPAANVEDHVPDGSSVTTFHGTATLGVGVLRCAAASVDGTPVGRVLVSDVGVGIAAPADCADACDGTHFYQLWQVTDSTLLRARMSALGVAGALVREMSLEMQALPGLTRADAMVPWAAGWYGLSTRTAGPAPAGPLAGTPNWWHETRHGAVRVRYSFPGETVLGVGGGTVATEEGTPMAELLGQERHGPGLLITASRIRGVAESLRQAPHRRCAPRRSSRRSACATPSR